MNRDIEFRAWDKYKKKMYPVSDIMFDIFKEHIFNVSLGLNNGFNMSYTKYHKDDECDINALILMQYTGLKDKNGKKIFEGDIIDIHQTVNGYNQFVIVYNNYQFTAEYYNEKTKRRTHRFYEYDLDELFEINECEKEIEVIGNIYENNLESKGDK